MMSIRRCREDLAPVGLALLDAGADAGLRDAAGRTPLHAAAEAGSAPLVVALLARGAAVDAPDGSGDSPLGLARRNGHRRVADLLAAHLGGARP